ncbi:MAG: RNA-binding protein [Candidatus Omnitrophica bacterium]|nr:RNA-binding protein [Candidatus Omnitrophota bacterium]
MEEQKKLYIGNLEYGVTEESLKAFIEEKGLTVSSVKLITDKYSGKSKGFGFAEFETEDQAQAAVDSLNEQEFNGRKLTVNKARKMQPRKDNFGGGSSGGSGGGRGGNFGGRNSGFGGGRY